MFVRVIHGSVLKAPLVGPLFYMTEFHRSCLDPWLRFGWGRGRSRSRHGLMASSAGGRRESERGNCGCFPVTLFFFFFSSSPSAGLAGYHLRYFLAPCPGETVDVNYAGSSYQLHLIRLRAGLCAISDTPSAHDELLVAGTVESGPREGSKVQRA
ncbi:hypothetical protein GQ53DRAFT_237889 [Thozetella sp. PMI_491]|nr:hypothetical protein GQ53DRAFT_237889 [Thozetella sp. PMI_491]